MDDNLAMALAAISDAIRVAGVSLPDEQFGAALAQLGAIRRNLDAPNAKFLGPSLNAELERCFESAYTALRIADMPMAQLGQALRDLAHLRTNLARILLPKK